MSELFAEPTQLDVFRASSWRPIRRRGRAHVGLAPSQQIAFSIIGSGLALIVGVVVVFAVVQTILFVPIVAAVAAVPWLGIGRAGIDLGRLTLRLYDWRPRPVILHRDDVEGFEVTEDHRVIVVARDGRRLRSWAPRGSQGVFDDGAFDAKVAYLHLWHARNPDDPAPELVDSIATPEPPADDKVERFPVRTLVVLFGIAVVVGYLFIGRDVIVLALAMLGLLAFAREPGRPLALAAFLLLVISAIATILPEIPPRLVIGYANRRPTAAEAGAIVGLFLVLSTAIFAVTERSPTPAPVRPIVRWLTAAQRRAVVKAIPAWFVEWVPFVAIVVVALGVRKVLSSAPLDPVAYGPLIDNLRLGLDYSLRTPSGGVLAAAYPPLAPVVVAYFPLGPANAQLLVSTATVVVAAVYAHRIRGRSAALLAALLAALAPSMWAPQLPTLLAALFVACGVALADPMHSPPFDLPAGTRPRVTVLSGRRGLLAGACLGLAFLARPDAGIAVPVVIAWLVLATPKGERPRGPIAALVVGFVAVAAPWLNAVWSQVGLPWPTESLATTLNDPTAATRLPALAMFGAGVIGVALTGVAASALWSRRIALLPCFAIPAAAVLLGLTGLPNRDLLSWSAPLAVVLVATWLAPKASPVAPGVFEAPEIGSFDEIVESATDPLVRS